MKKLLRLCVCPILCLCLLLGGCSIDKKGSQVVTDRSKSVIELGEEKVTYAEFRSVFDNYIPYMQYYGQDPLKDIDSLESFQDWVTDVLCDDLVTLHQAKLSGFTLSEEQESALQKDIEDGIKEIYDELMKYADQDFSNDPSVPLETYFENLVYTESEYHTGEALNWEDYKLVYEQNCRNSYLITAYRDHICEEFRPSSELIQSWYDSANESDKENYTEAPEKYKTDMEYFEQNFGVSEETVYPLTYAPSGYYRVKQIVCKPEGELPEEYKAMLERMETIKTEYSDLAFEDAVSGTQNNSEAMAALVNEYRGLVEETEEQYESFLASAKAKIYRAYNALEGGRAFDEVMPEFTEDELITGGSSGEGCAAFREKGRLISLRYQSEKDWSDNFKSEFRKLRKGEYSEPFIDDGCWCIIFYASDEPSGSIPLEEVYEYIEANTVDSVRDSEWEALLEEWKRDPELTIYEDLIRTVGLEDLEEEG